MRITPAVAARKLLTTTAGYLAIARAQATMVSITRRVSTTRWESPTTAIAPSVQETVFVDIWGAPSSAIVGLASIHR